MNLSINIKLLKRKTFEFIWKSATLGLIVKKNK